MMLSKALFILTSSHLLSTHATTITTLRFHCNLAANFNCHFPLLLSLITIQVTQYICSDVSNVKLGLVDKKWEVMNADTSTLQFGCFFKSTISPG
jgi:hypothetical protein